MDNAAEAALWIVEQGGCQGIFHAISEEDLERILRHPATMIASDGESPDLWTRPPTPRSYGTFARVLAVYVRERQPLTLEDAVRKMTSFPAQRLGLAGSRAAAAGPEGRPGGLRSRARPRCRDVRHAAPVRGRLLARHRERTGRVRARRDDAGQAGEGVVRKTMMPRAVTAWLFAARRRPLEAAG